MAEGGGGGNGGDDDPCSSCGRGGIAKEGCRRCIEGGSHCTLRVAISRGEREWRETDE